MPPKTILTWSDIDIYVENIINSIESFKFTPDILVSVGRGGMIPTRMISDYFLKAEVIYVPYKTYVVGGYTQTQHQPIISLSLLDDIIKGQNILLIDDISDSGSTLMRCQDMIHNYAKFRCCNTHFKVYSSSLVTKKRWQPLFKGITLDNENWIVFPWEKNEFEKGDI